MNKEHLVHLRSKVGFGVLGWGALRVVHRRIHWLGFSGGSPGGGGLDVEYHCCGRRMRSAVASGLGPFQWLFGASRGELAGCYGCLV